MNLSLQSDGSLKRPVLALFRRQLSFDGLADGLVILDGGFVFIGSVRRPTTKLIHIDVQMDLSSPLLEPLPLSS